MYEIASQFTGPASITDIAPFGSGHINSSYRVKTAAGNYLLQRINHHIFPDVPALSENIRLVTDHIRAKIATATGEAALQQTLTLVPTRSDELWHRDEADNYWRSFQFLDGLVAYDVVESPEQAYAGARSFGHFLRFLHDFPAGRIVAVLPDFHNIIARLHRFDLARTQVQGEKRRAQCATEIKQVQSLADKLTQIQKAWEKGILTTRVTHNDTKFNNVLLSPEGEGRAVIDLDTVMPGVVHFDFGDGIRTGAATAAEDEADLALVDVDPEKQRAFTAGYLSVARDLLSPAELHYLPLSGPLLAYIMGVRFLTDYLEGDVYYSTKYPDHNLVRARNQLRLAEVLLARSR